MKYLKEVVLAIGIVQLFFGSQQSFPVLVVATAFYIVVSTLDLYREKFLANEATTRMSSSLSLLEGEVKGHKNILLVIESQVVELQKSHATLKSMAEDSKKMISQANLGLGFRAVKREP